MMSVIAEILCVISESFNLNLRVSTGLLDSKLTLHYFGRFIIFPSLWWRERLSKWNQKLALLLPPNIKKKLWQVLYGVPRYCSSWIIFCTCVSHIAPPQCVAVWKILFNSKYILIFTFAIWQTISTTCPSHVRFFQREKQQWPQTVSRYRYKIFTVFTSRPLDQGGK